LFRPLGSGLRWIRILRMAKTAIISWRIKPDLRMRLEAAARLRGLTLGQLLNLIIEQSLRKRKKRCADNRAEQARIRAAAAKCIGKISGGDPHGSEKVRETVRRRLMERYEREAHL
jgi:hypothetical protein